MIFLNDVPVNITLFPDKTSQCWKLPEKYFTMSRDSARVLWSFEHEGEFLQIAQLCALIDKGRFNFSVLELPYLPYGRQDKEIDNNSTFALRVFAKQLNSLGFDQVIIQDPHSDVALQLIKNSEATYPIKYLEEICQEIGQNQELILCYPDKGALTKYTKVYKTLYRPYIYGEKVRDQATGKITSYQVIGECAGKSVMIVDDICDGGATFKILAKDLLAAGATEVNLFVTHGIFSQGVKTLFESGISRVFTKNGQMARPE